MRLIQGPLTEGAEVGRLMDTIYLASMQQPDPDSSPKWAPPSAAMWTGGDAAAGGAPPKAVSASLINYSKDRKAMRNPTLHQRRTPPAETRRRPRFEVRRARRDRVRALSHGGP